MSHEIVNHTPRRTNKARAIRQALAMQDTAFALAQEPDTAPSTVAQLMRAWCDVEERLRVIRMKPKPKDIDVAQARGRAPRATAPQIRHPEPVATVAKVA